MATKDDDWVDVPADEWVDVAPQAAAPAAPPAQAPKMGAGEAFAHGAGQGLSFGFLDELAGLAAKVGIGDVPKLGKAFAPSPDDTPEVAKLKREALAQEAAQPTAYELARDAVRRKSEQAAKESPKAYYGGMVGSGILSAIPTGGAGAAATAARAAAPAAGLGARMVGGALTGAGMGALSGAGASTADMSQGEAARLLLDMAGGGAGGAVIGGLAPAGGAAASWVADRTIRPVAQRLGAYARDKAPEWARGAMGFIQQHEQRLTPERARDIGQWANEEGITAPRSLLQRLTGVGKQEIRERLEAKAAEESVNDLLATATGPHDPSRFPGRVVEWLQDPATTEAARRQIARPVSNAMGDFMRTTQRMRTRHVPQEVGRQLGRIADELAPGADDPAAIETLRQLMPPVPKALPPGPTPAPSALQPRGAPPALATRRGLERAGDVIEGEVVSGAAPRVPGETIEGAGTTWTHVRERVPRTLADLNRLKTDWQKGTNYNANARETFQNEANRTLARILREDIDQQASELLSPENFQRYLTAKRDYGNAQEALKAVTHAIGREAGNNPITPSGLVAGAAELATGLPLPEAASKAGMAAMAAKFAKERASSLIAPRAHAVGQRLEPTTEALLRLIGPNVSRGLMAPGMISGAEATQASLLGRRRAPELDATKSGATLRALMEQAEAERAAQGR